MNSHESKMADDLRAMVFEVAERGNGWQRISGLPGASFAGVAGWIGLVASPRGLRLLSLPLRRHDATLRYIRRHYSDVAVVADDSFLLDVSHQVQAYLAGSLAEFSVELDLRGHTAFELAVWAAVARIPYGQTRTYAWVADQVGGGRGAAQAAGAAVGSNPVPLIVPCHRVIGSDGSLHGFAGGLAMKARLLALESGQAAFPLDSAS